MSRLLCLSLLFVLTQTALCQLFPTCSQVLQTVSSTQNYLFDDAANAPSGRNVRGIVQNQCIEPRNGQNTLIRVYLCPGGVEIIPNSGAPIPKPLGLPLNQRYQVSAISTSMSGQVICSRSRGVPIPTGTVPPATQPCPRATVPTRVSDFARGEKSLCATACFVRAGFNGISFGSSSVNPIVVCCQGYRVQGSISRFGGFFSFGPKPTCVKV